MPGRPRTVSHRHRAFETVRSLTEHSEAKSQVAFWPEAADPAFPLRVRLSGGTGLEMLK